MLASRGVDHAPGAATLAQVTTTHRVRSVERFVDLIGIGDVSGARIVEPPVQVLANQ